VPRFSRLRDVVDFVAASLISYYGYANSFSDGPCRHPNSEWLQRRFLSPPEFCRLRQHARGKQTTSRFSYMFFSSITTHYHQPCVSRFRSAAAPNSSLRSFALSFKLSISLWLVCRPEPSTERPVGPFPILFAPWLPEPVPFLLRLLALLLAELDKSPLLPPWPLGPISQLPLLAARPNPLLLVPLAVRPSLPSPSPPPPSWSDASVFGALNMPRRSLSTTVFSTKTVRLCVLVVGL
jgi:hypothetical protein